MGSGEVVRRGLTSALDTALSVQRPVLEAYIRRARADTPDISPQALVARLEKQYLFAVTSMGVLAGGAAAVPGISLGPGLVVNLAEVTTFLETTTLFCLGVAEVHGLPADDPARRRALVVGVLLGNGGSSAIRKAAGRVGPYWGRAIVRGIPMTAVNSANRVLGPRFVTKWGTQQGVLVLGRELPFGLGAGIGGAGNNLLGRMTIRSVRAAFGPPPARFPDASAL